MSRQFWNEAISWATAAGSAIANTTTESILFPNVTIPANYLQDGRVLKLRLYGAYGTTSGSNTMTIRIRWGGLSGTILASTGAITLTASSGGGASMTAIWSANIIIQTRSNGSSGTLFTNGDIFFYSATPPTGGTITNYGMPAQLVSGSTGGSTPVAVTADLTADTALAITATWGTANSANSIRGDIYIIESLN